MLLEIVNEPKNYVKMIHPPLGQLQARTLTNTAIFRQCSGHLVLYSLSVGKYYIRIFKRRYNISKK